MAKNQIGALRALPSETQRKNYLRLYLRLLTRRNRQKRQLYGKKFKKYFEMCDLPSLSLSSMTSPSKSSPHSRAPSFVSSF